MVRLALSILFAGISFCSYSQNEYIFKYKYFQLLGDEIEFPSIDTNKTKNQLANRLSSNVFIDGIKNAKGTLLHLYLKEEDVNLKSSNIHLHLEPSKSADPYIFYDNKFTIKVEESDTECYYIDTTSILIATGAKKTINNWPCIEFKPTIDEYKHISIWASPRIPSAIKPGIFSKIKYGIVQIYNSDKKMGVQLVDYKKSKDRNYVPLKCTNNAGKKYQFLDAYK